ncbi:MAG: hypothetical protein JXA64_04430 [Candidatus Fermentibacteraceae bacterium]|nr:hypothetical protein [Candidatus Fermentibacteraceae bacterium]MBN2608340.1 hypothetical protein [Candidatus Fermentibacteraceae bacterium]
MRIIARLMILTLVFQPVLRASHQEMASRVVPGEMVGGSFDEGVSEVLYVVDTRGLQSYTFRDRGGLRLVMEVLDRDGQVLFSTAYSGDDQWAGSGDVHWDCLVGGAVTIRVKPALPGTAGEFAFILEEAPGWLAATSLSSVTSLEGRLDYPGDVDYFSFERTEEERVFEISLLSDSSLSLFWVDTRTGVREATVEGTELSLVENYPGGDLSKTDAYYGVSGPATVYSVSGTVEEDGGLSTWIIVGIASGVVCLLLGLYVYNQAEESCGSCNIPSDGLFGNSSGCTNSGCSGG